MRRLVLIHGRSQQHKDAAALKAEWLECLRTGLGKSGLTLPVSADEVKFPYYGDTLFQLTQGMSAEEAADVIIKGPADQAPAEFIQSVTAEMQAQSGVSDAQVAAELGVDVADKGPLNWAWVQGLLSFVDRHVPFGSGASIALFTNDAYHYLRSSGIRDDIEKQVAKALVPEVPTVVVGHSLGSVVAYNLLRRDGVAERWRVPLFVTIGSPLAVTAVRTALAPIGFPACVTSWFNAMDDRDVVALHPLEFDVDPPIVNKTDVDNHTPNRHGVAGYLEDAEVARRIHDALVA